MKVQWILLCLVAWIGGSSYWYVCKIRSNCQGSEAAYASSGVEIEVPEVAPQSLDAFSEDLDADAKRPHSSEPLESSSTPNEATDAYDTLHDVIYFEAYQYQVDWRQLHQHTKQLLQQKSKERKIVRILIEGFSDTSGDDKSNIALSKKRSLSVKNLFTDLAIDDRLISQNGNGSLRPIATNTTPEGRTRNRRVEVKTILYE